MSSMALEPNPQTVAAPPTDDPNLQIAPAQAFTTPGQYMLPQDFASLVQQGAPMGAFTDAQYLADEAALRNQIAQQYSQILQQLGYRNPATGAVIPGRVVQDANLRLAGYQNDLQNAARQVTQNAQQTGTIFSGMRPQLLAQAEFPTHQAMGQLSLDTARQLSDIYNNAQGLISQYNTQNNQALAQAAARQAAAIMQAKQLAAFQAAQTAGGGGGGFTGVTDASSSGPVPPSGGGMPITDVAMPPISPVTIQAALGGGAAGGGMAGAVIGGGSGPSLVDTLAGGGGGTSSTPAYGNQYQRSRQVL